MWLCKNCGTEVDNENLLSCWNCGYAKDGSPPADRETLEEARSIKADPHSPRLKAPPRTPVSSGNVNALRIFGWVALVAGIFGAAALFLGWLTRPWTNKEDGLYPIVMAFAVAFQGAFVFVLCQVIAEMADTVQAIRSELYSRR